MATRKKKVAVVPPLNPKEADKVMAAYAMADARRSEINALIDEQFTKIREKYAEELEQNKEVLEVNFQKMQMYAETRPELFKAKKSYDTTHGTIGFRTGTPKLKAKKGFTLASVLMLLKSKGKKATMYIRTKEEIARDVLIANRKDAQCKVLLEEVGLDVIQDDTFYIDLKKEEAEA